MNYSNPVLICDENEEFRVLMRDMLTKNGFFHVIEAANAQEALEALLERKGFFVLIDSRLLSAQILSILSEQKDFIVFADSSDPLTATLAARLGVNHIMSYPFHSKKLMDKIHSLI